MFAQCCLSNRALKIATCICVSSVMVVSLLTLSCDESPTQRDSTKLIMDVKKGSAREKRDVAEYLALTPDKLNEEHTPLLLGCVAENDDDFLEKVSICLNRRGAKSLLNVLIAVYDQNERVRLCAIASLGRPRLAFERSYSKEEDKIILPILIDVLRDQNPKIRVAAARNIYDVSIDSKQAGKALNALRKSLVDKDSDVLHDVIHSIGLFAEFSKEEYDYGSLAKTLAEFSRNDKSKRVRNSADMTISLIRKRPKAQ
jgi:HEAT repeat protein